MPKDFDVVCVGDAKIDIFLTLHEASEHLRLIRETNELCIKFGDKIAVDKADVLVGGDAANVATGTARLGLKTSIVAETGKDEFARKIINFLISENVDISNILQTEGQQSSLSTIINYREERTIFSEHVRREHNFNFNDISTKWIYLTSLGEKWQDAYGKTIDFVKKTGCRLAFNPGTRQIESGKDNMKNILTATDLLLVNKEEAEELLNLLHGQENVEKIITDLQKLGPKIVVVTDGKNGSFAIDEKRNILKKDISKTEVIEKTGAGDAYSSGFLSALMNNKSIVESMEWGTKNSASVIGKVGATSGLLRKIDFKK